MRLIVLTVGLMFGNAALAERTDFLVTDGRLTDEDFYRLVACRAYPGKPCQQDMVRWSPSRAAALRVGFDGVAPGYPNRLRDELDDALDRAIASINNVGAALALQREPSPSAQDITIHLIGSRGGEPIRGTGNYEMDGTIIGAALVHVRWNGRRQLEEATIAMASDLPLSTAYPVLLEELTQALGLLTDIRNPFYETTSVFSEDSNIVTKLGVQDREALRRHYPAQ